MADLIESRISEIRERLAQLSTLPWRLDDSAPIYHGFVYCDDVLGSAVAQCDLSETVMISREQAERNAEFIAHAPSDLEALLAENLRLDTQLRDAIASRDKWYREAQRLGSGLTDEVGAPLDPDHTVKFSAEQIAAARDVLLAARLSAPLDPSSAPSETPETQSDDLCVCGCRRSDQGTIYQPPSERTGACMTRGRHDGWCPAFKLAAPDREAGDGTDERAEPSTAICFADDEDGFCGAFRPCPKHESEASAAYHAKAKERLASSHPVSSEVGGE